ncbi:Yip1 domain protein [uncultured archaeon]|nr:Yip1 domain protein [uncultured archaeon]
MEKKKQPRAPAKTEVSWLSEFKETTVNALKRPPETAKKIRKSADLNSGLKFFATATVCVFLINFFVNLVVGVLNIVSNLNASGVDVIAAAISAVFTPVISLLAFPFGLVAGLFMSLLWVFIVWIVGRALGGKAEYKTLYGTLLPVQGAVGIAGTAVNGVISILMYVILAFAGLLGLAGILLKSDITNFISLVVTLVRSGGGGLVMLAVGAITFFVGLYYSTVFVREAQEFETWKALVSVLVPVVIMLVVVVAVLLLFAAIFGVALLSSI